MPPPRRFSAAPTLSCPHRNKSSSHSSSSLHHTYSIDSSESMITVIPVNRASFASSSQTNTEFGKRSSRGSLSCTSSAGAGSGGTGLELNGSFYALPRSPLSPRSPSRCSPSLLTPNTSEPPFSPVTTTTCSSSAGNQTTIVQPAVPVNEQAASTSSNQQYTTATDLKADEKNITNPKSMQNLSTVITNNNNNNLFVLSGEEDNLSIAVENGTSYNSSRVELDELECLDQQTDVETDIIDTLIKDSNNQTSKDQESESKLFARRIPPNPNVPIIRETINDFCAKHTREELEFLVEQVGFLSISDCYFSEGNSTLCMVIEVKEK